MMEKGGMRLVGTDRLGKFTAAKLRETGIIQSR